MAGFAAGIANGHHLVNRSDHLAIYLEVGDRTASDQVNYPDQDLKYMLVDTGGRVFTRKNDHPY